MKNTCCRACLGGAAGPFCIVEKPGHCPRVEPGQSGHCAQRCQNDSDCSGFKKCCSNGCGTQCTAPPPGTDPACAPSTASTVGPKF
uniref:WAP domain-containing protein n=1 Tax=Sphenodon punctatus TaxID=8508 RepID=A0A8D0HUM8_SPHPU